MTKAQLAELLKEVRTYGTLAQAHVERQRQILVQAEQDGRDTTARRASLKSLEEKLATFLLDVERVIKTLTDARSFDGLITQRLGCRPTFGVLALRQEFEERSAKPGRSGRARQRD